MNVFDRSANTDGEALSECSIAVTTQETIDVSRRRFVVGTGLTGLGLSLGFTLPLSARGAHHEVEEINAWVVVEPDDTVVVRIARSEMGQGTLTGLAQMVAEELECDWDKVTWEYASPAESVARDRVWGSFGTGGSQGIRGSHQYVREGGAAARMMLIEAAANAWKVPVAECSALASVITHEPSGQTTTFGAMAAAAAQLVPPEEIPLKDPADWTLIGKPKMRLDTADKLNGSQLYSSDLRRPGMLNATIKACPVRGGTVASFDASAVEDMPGVIRVVPVEDNAVAVVADTFWHAKKAMDALPIEWDRGENGSINQADIVARIDEGLTADDTFMGNEAGDVDGALADAAQSVEAVYSYPFLNHATMEPMTATAKWTEDRCEVWCPTQNGEAALAATAEAAGLELTQCEVYKQLLGGGFGRRGATDYVQQAVLLAKEMPGTPIKLSWTREEDMAHGFYHPITKAKIEGGLDAEGRLTALRMRISGQSILYGLMPERLNGGPDRVVFQALAPDGDHAISYGIPNLRVDHAMRNPHIRPGFWRGVNVNQNAIYMECFLDECAHAAGVDPLLFRQRMMEDNPKGLAVLNAVAERAGWGTSAGEGIHRGLANCYSFGSYTAACAEVSVNDAGELKIHRIVAATDPGFAVNPQQIEAQVQGSFVYGLSALLYGECTVKDGAMEQQNFHEYQSLRLAQMPEVETIVMPSGGFWGGVGEPTIAVAAPAVLNAIFAATGTRVRDVPLKGRNLRA
ncbi:MAG: molybdopterin cofactor-binding domain-containing protein [Pseudomonadota bacterium]